MAYTGHVDSRLARMVASRPMIGVKQLVSWSGVWALAIALAAGAQESPASWMQRILDPQAVGIEAWPGAELNRKFSVDTIRLEKDPSKRIAVYLAPLENLPAASEHYRTQLGVEPAITGAGSEFETHVYSATGEGSYPKAAEGMVVRITRSPWSTGSLQITIELAEPAPAPGS